MSLLATNRLLDGSSYGSTNFTSCVTDALINVTQVSRQYDRLGDTFQLLIEGYVPGITYPPVESRHNWKEECITHMQ